MNIIPILGQISGDAMIHNLFRLLIYAAALGALWAFVVYAIAPGEPWNKWLRIIFAFCGLILVLNFLLSLGGSPLIRW